MKQFFKNALLFDGKGGAPFPGWLLTEKGHITGLGPGELDFIPKDSKIWNLDGKTLLPGLIDCHVHLGLDGSADPALAIGTESEASLALSMGQRAIRTLAAGFTTIRDLGCKGHVDLTLKKAVQQGDVPGPRILCAGRFICMTGGHGWQFGVEADGPAEVAKAARKELKAGADVIKLMATGGICTEGVEPGQAQLGLDELKAAVDEAHKDGRKSAAHAQGLTGIKNALWAGIDSIEHGTYLDEEAVGLMLEKGVWLVPTLSAGDNMIRNGKEAGIPAFAVDKSMAHRKPRLKSLALAHKAGVKIAMGTDAGTPCNKHGENARELCLMVDNGFTPQEALTAACHGAAEVLGLDAETGSLEPGKRADLLIVNGSPLENIGLLTLPENILGVFKDGALAAGSWVKEVGKGS